MKFEKHREFLKDTIDQDSALLDKFLRKEILCTRTIAEIKSQTTPHGRNEKLLEHLKSRKKEISLLATLTEDNQRHIVNYIESDGKYDERYGDCWPLNERERYILGANQESLVDRIDAVDCELITKLFSQKVINLRQKDIIQAESVSFKKNEKLLDILRRRSLEDYKTTISCLKQTKQEHIAVLLEHGGVTAELDIKLTKSATADVNTETAEKVIIDLVKNVLQPTSAEDNRAASLQDIPGDVLQQSERDISDMMERLNLNDARKGNSIILSFHCREISDLRKVKEELSKEHIEDMFSKLYGSLLATEEVKVKVQWHKVSYKQCQNYFQDEDDDGLSTEDADELIPCEDDLTFALSQTHLGKRISRIESPKLCYYPSQEHVASLLLKRIMFIFSYYHNGRRLEDFEDFDFRIYTAGSSMLQEQTRRRLCDKDSECFPSNVYENSVVLKNLSERHVKTYRATMETEKDLNDLIDDAVKNPNKLYLIVADEAHFGASEGGRGRKLINTWSHEKHPNVFVILVTATPGIFFRDSTSSRIPRMSVAEKQKDGEFVIVKFKDELRKKEIVEIGNGKDISKEVGPVKQLHVFNWSEYYERRFEKGLVVTLRVPQRLTNKREEPIWLSMEDLEDCRVNELSKNKLNRLVGQTNKDFAIPLLLRGRNNVVKITSLDERKTLVAMSSSSQAKSYEVGFVPNTKLDDKMLCAFKVLIGSGEDILELEVYQDDMPLTRLRYTYAKSIFELGPATTDAWKLGPAMTYQFLIDSSRCLGEDKSGPQYLSLNFYYNSIRNHAPEEQLIRQDKNFENMVSQFKYTEADQLLAAEYAYHIVLLDCTRKATPKANSFQRFISKPAEFWMEYLEQRRSKLETMKSALRDSKNSVKPIESSYFSEFIKYTEEKTWKEFQKICNTLKRQKELKQNNIDNVYEVLIGYLLHANPDSFKRNMMGVRKVLERHMQVLTKHTDNFKDYFNAKKICVLCRNETFRIVSDLIQEEGIEEEQGSLNGHMKIIRASCTEMANNIYTTLTLARKVASDTDDCFFEIIRYFQRFKLSVPKTNGLNSRIWQILQPKHCTNYHKKTLVLCRCENYDPKDNKLKCKNCNHPHHSVNTFFDLDRLPCIVIVVEMGRMGDTFPPSLNVMDLRARRPKTPSLPFLIQEVGRISRYQVKSSYSDLPYVLVASKVMTTLEENLHKSASFIISAKLEANNEPNWHHNRLLLVGEPQIGKTGVFLNIAAQLRKIVKGPNDKFDFPELPKNQTTRKRSAGENESDISEKRRKVCKSQSSIESKVSTPTCDSEDDFQESTTASEVKKKMGASAKQHKFADLVHCTICSKTFVHPRNLPCLHTFCLKCIQRVCDEKPDDALITCPICEEEFIFPDNGSEGLEENAFIKRLVDMTNISTSSFSRASCDVCESKPAQSNFEIPKAVLFCEECQEKLCDECKVFHERQHHELLQIEERHLYRSMTEFCNQHNKPLDMYCKDCGKISCAICLMDHKEHKEYSIVKTVVGEYRESLRKNTEAVKVAEENAKKNIPILQKEINLRRSCIEHLQKQSEELERRKVDLERHLSNAEHCRTYCQELAEKGTVNDVLREAAAWQTKSDEVKECHESMNEIHIPTVEDTVNAAVAECSMIQTFLEQYNLN